MRKVAMALAAVGWLALGCNSEQPPQPTAIAPGQPAPGTDQRPGDWTGFGRNPNYEATGNLEGAGGGAYDAHETRSTQYGIGFSGAESDGGMAPELATDGGMAKGKKHGKPKAPRKSGAAQ